VIVRVVQKITFSLETTAPSAFVPFTNCVTVVKVFFKFYPEVGAELTPKFGYCCKSLKLLQYLSAYFYFNLEIGKSAIKFEIYNVAASLLILVQKQSKSSVSNFYPSSYICNVQLPSFNDILLTFRLISHSVTLIFCETAQCPVHC